MMNGFWGIIPRGSIPRPSHRHRYHILLVLTQPTYSIRSLYIERIFNNDDNNSDDKHFVLRCIALLIYEIIIFSKIPCFHYFWNCHVYHWPVYLMSSRIMYFDWGFDAPSTLLPMSAFHLVFSISQENVIFIHRYANTTQFFRKVWLYWNNFRQFK